VEEDDYCKNIMIQAQEHLHPDTLDRIVERIFSSHKITRADQQRFMSAMLSRETLSGEDQKKINRVFDALQKGLLRVVD
jgi:transcriptional regulator CtsR